MGIKIKQVQMIEVGDWDRLVQETYGRPYSFQQQDGCQPRGIIPLTVPAESDDEEWPDSIPEKINGDEMGVNFKAWLARDPKQPLADGRTDQWRIYLFWERNFYPPLQDVANDLHAKGLLQAGEYNINIDW